MDDKIIKIKENINETNELLSHINQYLNIVPVRNELLKNSSNFNRIFSSIWVIEDTNLAIEEYLSSEYPEETGLRYIFTYGILQSLFIQQDAFKNLNEALNHNFELCSELKEIRELRNYTIGHPTHQVRKKQNYYSYVSRCSLEKERFEFERFNASEIERKYIKVELIDKMLVQTKSLLKNTRKLSQHLKEKERERKLKFVEVKMEELLPKDARYLFEKILGAIASSEKGFGLSMLKVLEKGYLSFIEELKRRGELPNDLVEYDLNQYMNAISRIKDYLNGNEIGMNEFDARTYGYYLEKEHESFLELAEEYDDKY